MAGRDAAWARQTQRELRTLLNEWDPIGVFDRDAFGDLDGPIDEYDCLRDQLISALLKGSNRQEVTRILRREVADHFRLDPNLVTGTVVERIHEWWSRRH